MRHILSIVLGFLLIFAFVFQTNATTQQYEMTLEIISIKVLNDHDPIGAGEIFITIQINGHDKYRSEKWQLNDGETKNKLDIQFMNVLTIEDIVRIRLREEDTGSDDSLGDIIIPLQNMTSITETTMNPSDGKITYSVNWLPIIESTNTNFKLEEIIIYGIIIVAGLAFIFNYNKSRYN